MLAPDGYGITTAWTVGQTTHSLLRLTQFTDKQTDRQVRVCVCYDDTAAGVRSSQ